MCRFCHQHGEGKTWYLQAQNYGEDLLSDLNRRRNIRDFVAKVGIFGKQAQVKNISNIRPD